MKTTVLIITATVLVCKFDTGSEYTVNVSLCVTDPSDILDVTKTKINQHSCWTLIVQHSIYGSCSAGNGSLTGPHWHFDQSTMHCFDFALIWQSGRIISLQKYNLLADTCCALVFPECHSQHTAGRTIQMQLKLSLLFQILLSDLLLSFFPPMNAHTCQTVMCEVYCAILSKGQTHAAKAGMQKNASF